MKQNAFAHRIGTDVSNFSKQLNGKLQVSDSLINKIVVNVGISKDWLLKGDGVPFAKNDRPSTIIVGEMEERRSGTPVYDIDVTAGAFFP